MELEKVIIKNVQPSLKTRLIALSKSRGITLSAMVKQHWHELCKQNEDEINRQIQNPK